MCTFHALDGVLHTVFYDHLFTATPKFHQKSNQSPHQHTSQLSGCGYTEQSTKLTSIKRAHNGTGITYLLPTNQSSTDNLAMRQGRLTCLPG